MNQPRFVCGAIDYYVEHPVDWDRNMLVGKNEIETLGGTTVRDVTFRKYQYILRWDAMSKTDFEKLLEVYNAHIDNVTDVTFTWPKWSTASSVACKMEMNSQKFRAGSGSTIYLSQAEVILTEVEPR